jgi:large subunit ribosomal protein L19
MSTAISCTRAAVPRATYGASRCRRFASTEAVSTGTATPPIISTQRAKKITEPLNVKMHRLLYPEHYEKRDARNWKPKPGVARTRTHRPAPKPMDDKWAAAMRQEGVQKHLSKSTLSNLSLDIFRNSNRFPTSIKSPNI